MYRSSEIQKYYITGILGSFLPGAIANIIFLVMRPMNYQTWGIDTPFQPIANGLIGGFLAGLIGGLIAKKFPRYNDFGYMMLTGILGFTFSIVGNVVFFVTSA